MSHNRPQIALSALATLAFWTTAGVIGGTASGFLVPELLLFAFPPKPSRCGMLVASLLVTGGGLGSLVGLIAGIAYANHAVRRKYGPRWRDRIRDRGLSSEDAVTTATTL